MIRVLPRTDFSLYIPQPVTAGCRPPQAHPPSQAELAAISGQGQAGRDVDLGDAYGCGDRGSSSEEEEEAQEAEAAADGGDAAAAPAAASQQRAGGGGRGGKGGGGGKKHAGKLQAAQFSEAEVERRRAQWEQRIQRADMHGLIAGREALPIAAYREAVVQALDSHQAVLIAGETGCGKTTQVCGGVCVCVGGGGGWGAGGGGGTGLLHRVWCMTIA